MSRPEGAPPRLASALVVWLAGPGDPGSLVGDLDEEYTSYQLPNRGRRAADSWYRRQVVLSLPALVVRRLRGKPDRGTGLAKGGRVGGSPPGELLGDLRFALRVLRRRPGYTVATVLTLGLGLGVNTTLFTVVHAVLLRPLPFADVDRLVRPVPDELFFIDASEAELLDQRMTTFESFAAWGRTLFLFTDGAEAEEVRGARVSWSHFDMLGVEAMLGRTFVRDDAATDDAIVLGHGLWVRRFGADPSVVGGTVDLYGRVVRVIGVLGPEHVPVEYDWQAWRPIPLDPEAIANSGLAANARLRDGVTLEQARQEFRRVMPEIWEGGGYVASAEERASLDMAPLGDWLLGDVRTPLAVLTAAVALILLLACVNVSSLMIAQGGSRADEFALRAALGGSRARVGRQVLIEVTVLTAMGGLLAVGLGSMSLGWLSSILPAELPRADAIALGPEVMVFTVVAAIVAVLLTGTLPAVRAAGRAPARLVSAGRRGGGSRERVRARFLLVSTEMAMAVVLVVGASLTLRSLASLQSVDPGFEANGVVTVRPSPPSATYGDDQALAAYYDRLGERLRGLRGVTSVGGIQFLPMTPGGWWASYLPEGRALGDHESRPNTAVRVVWGDYFETMRIPVVEGRDFEPTDRLDGAEPVALINEALVAEAFPGGDAVGRAFALGDATFRVAGVVADVRQSDVRQAGHPEIYLPFSARPWRRTHLVVRGTTDAEALAVAVGQVVREVDAGVSMEGPRTMTTIVEGTIADARLLTTLLTLFGLTGLALGAVGVHGVTAQSVAERRREIGIRLALGAERTAVTRSTVASGLRPVVVGLGAGVIVALLVGRTLDTVLFDVRASDPGSIAVASLVLVLVALSALLLPALRAGRTDPVQSLRQE